MNDIIIIGYSGHSYVVLDAIYSNGYSVKGYCDREEKKYNPYDIIYLGKESIELISDSEWISGIGDNNLREKIHLQLKNSKMPISVIHPSAIVANNCIIGNGVFIAANTTLNPLANIGDAVIINTGAIIEHECKINDFAHVAPGAVLAGNVTIGKNTFVGANSVIKQGVKIGNNVIVGAGTVVLKDVPDNKTIVGNPGKVR